jgi:adenosine deaminase
VIDEQLLRALPKPELHQHLDGSVRVATVLDLAEQYGVSMPAQSEAELKEHIRVPPDCPSLDEYLIHSFGLVGSVLQHPEALTRVTYEVCLV